MTTFTWCKEQPHPVQIQYRRIYNGFPVFWLVVFSIAWYKTSLWLSDNKVPALTFAVIQCVHFLDIQITEAHWSSQGHIRAVQCTDRRLAIFGKRPLPIMHQAAVVVIKVHAIYFGMFVLVELAFHSYGTHKNRNFLVFFISPTRCDV